MVCIKIRMEIPILFSFGLQEFLNICEQQICALKKYFYYLLMEILRYINILMMFHIKLHDIFEILRVSLVGNPLKPLSIISKRPLKLRFS